MTDVYSHPDYQQFLARIRERPGDDLPRLVFADWLEERGQGERAEFIRVQVELGRTPPARGEFNRLQNRQLAFFVCRRGEWFPLGDRWDVELSDEFADVSETYGRNLAIVRRGFVSEIRCSLADWCGGECGTCVRGRVSGRNATTIECPVCRGDWQTTGIGPEVVRRHPVERVVLTDREPSFAYGGRCWFFGSRTESDVLTRELLGAMEGEHTTPTTDSKCYPTDEAAHAALSAALIAWAKSQPAPVVTSV